MRRLREVVREVGSSSAAHEASSAQGQMSDAPCGGHAARHDSDDIA
nr:unnamed protein product [Callosobruchus analis]